MSRYLPSPDLALIWYTLSVFSAALFGMSIGLAFAAQGSAQIFFWAYVVLFIGVLVFFFALLAYYTRTKRARLKFRTEIVEPSKEVREPVPQRT